MSTGLGEGTGSRAPDGKGITPAVAKWPPRGAGERPGGSSGVRTERALNARPGNRETRNNFSVGSGVAVHGSGLFRRSVWGT